MLDDLDFFRPLGETITIGRCIALSDWLATKSPHLWLKSSSEAKVWVQDIFRRPQSGDVISELEVRTPDVEVDSHLGSKLVLATIIAGFRDVRAVCSQVRVG